jgi:hypothetical protein
MHPLFHVAEDIVNAGYHFELSLELNHFLLPRGVNGYVVTGQMEF